MADARHVVAPLGHGGIFGHAGRADGPVKQPLIQHSQRQVAVVAVMEGLLGQRLNFLHVSLNADRAAADVEGIQIIIVRWVDQLRHGEGFRRAAFPVVVDNPADVDEVIQVSGVAVGHDLRAVGGEDGGLGRRRGGVDGRVQRFGLVERPCRAIQFLVAAFAGQG
ncbi:MAG: hypothetical protein IPG51_13910 [Chloroflexi bacterium]|nr:hypothetical protein [Chloroflexota bacterium]